MATARAPGGVLVDPATGIVQVSLSASIVGQVGDFPLASDGSVCVETEASQSRVYRNGLAYAASGKLIVDPSSAVAAFVHGMGMTVAGAFACDTSSSAAAFLRGLGFTAAGKMCIAGLLGPNLLTNPNGNYDTAPWTPDNIVNTAGQTDPLGGSTACLLTDTAANTTHRVFQTPTIAAGTYRVTMYFKPGTYAPVKSLTFFDAATSAITVDNSGNATNFAGSPTNITVTSVGGFFQCSFDVVSVGGSVFVTIEFNSPNLPYIGSGQTFTLWGCALQKIG